MRKRFVSIVAIALAAVCMFGCSDRPADPTAAFDPDAIVVMGKRSDMEKPYMTKIFELYTSKTGKKINRLEIADQDFEAEAQKRFSGGNAPDVLLHFNNDDLRRFNVAADFLYLNEESWVSDLTESADKYCRDENGNLLGLPFWESSVSGCYYNKKLFGELGMLKATTQADFENRCRELKKADITPICWPANGCSWMYQFPLDPVFADEPDGPELLDRLNADEIGYSDIPAVRKMASWLVKARDSGWFGTDWRSIGWDDIAGKLNSGECAMVFIWDTWFYTDFVDGKYKKEDFALMPVFMGTVDDGTYEGGNINMMMLNKNSEKLDLAKEFMRFCADPENYNAAFDGIATVNCFRGQTTTVQSHMVTDRETAASIAAHERVSTASTKIAGYSADLVAARFTDLLSGKSSIDECLRFLDADRLQEKSVSSRIRAGSGVFFGKS